MHNIKAIETIDIQRLTSGQVIIDLSTAVKELLDNSLDSGAKQIDITFKNYGIDAIEVSDNGSGIAKDDFEYLGLKHYTSKISHFGDIETLETLGFRGEAISSLCNISKVEIITTDKGPKAYKLQFDSAGNLTEQQITSRNTGTTVNISDLFYNLPVRRKEFVRVAKRQFTKCITLLQSYCIINYNVRISVNNITPNGRKALLISTRLNSSLKQNIINVFGSNSSNGIDTIYLKLNLNSFKTQIFKHNGFEDNYLSNWDEIDYQIHLNGYISKSSFGCGRNSKDRQFIYINSRPVEYATVVKIVNEVYRSFNNVQLPFFILNFDINPSLIDVNLTPDKRMILFHNETYVIDVLREELTKYFYDQELQLPKNVIQKTLNDHFLESQELKSEFVEDEEEDTDKGIKDDSNYDGRETIDSFGHSNINSGLNVEIIGGTSLFEHENKQTNKVVTKRSTEDEDTAIEEERKEQKNQDKIAYGNESNEKSRNGSGYQDLSSKPNIEDNVKDYEFDNDENGYYGDDVLDVADEKSEQIEEHIKEVEKRKDREDDVSETTLKQSITLSRPSKKVKVGNKNDYPVAIDNLKQFKHGNIDLNIERKENIDDTNDKFDHSTIEMNIDGEPIYMRATYSTDNNGLVTLRDITDIDNEESVPLNETSNAEDSKRNDYTELAEYDDNSIIGNSSLLNETNVRISIPHSQQELHENVINRTLSSAHRYYSNFKDNTNSMEYPDDNIHKTNKDKDKTQILDTAIPLEKGIVKLAKPNKRVKQRPNDMLKTNMIETDENETKNINTIKDQDKIINDLQYLNLTVNKKEFAQMRIVGQFNLGFIIVTRKNIQDINVDVNSNNENDLFIVDQHASDEKFNFEKLTKETKIQTQLLIAPEIIELSVIDELIVMDNIPIFKKNGFKVQVKEDNPPGQKIVLISKPISKHVIFNTNDFQELIQLIKDDSGNVSQKLAHIHCSKIRSMLAMRACRMSIMIGKPLTDKKMKQIVGNLGTLNKPWNCPHGRPTMRHLMELKKFKNTFNDDYEL